MQQCLCSHRATYGLGIQGLTVLGQQIPESAFISSYLFQAVEKVQLERALCLKPGHGRARRFQLRFIQFQQYNGRFTLFRAGAAVALAELWLIGLMPWAEARWFLTEVRPG